MCLTVGGEQKKKEKTMADKLTPVRKCMRTVEAVNHQRRERRTRLKVQKRTFGATQPLPTEPGQCSAL